MRSLFTFFTAFIFLTAAKAQEPPKVHFIVYNLFDENDVFKGYKTDMFPASVSNETRTNIKNAKKKLYQGSAAKVRTDYMRLEMDERVLIVKLNYKNSSGVYNRILIEDIKKTDKEYKASAQTIVNEYIDDAMDKSAYVNYEVLYDGVPFTIPKTSDKSYFDELYETLKKEVLEYIGDSDKKELEKGIKEEKKKAVGIGVRG
jgi:hypothetical protein